MSTPFSRRMQGVATRLLTRYGSTVKLVRTGARVWDAPSGEYITAPDTVIDLKSVPVPVKESLINGTTIRAGDMIVKADFSVQPTQADKIVFNATRWAIVGIEPKIVNDDVVAYFIQVRR